MSRVLDHRESMPPRDVIDGVHLAGVAVEVDGHDRFDARRPLDRGLDLARIDVEGVLLDVDEQRARALVLDDVDGRGESHRGGHHRVPFPDAECGQRDMHGRGGGVDRQGGRSSNVLRELGFELAGSGPGRQPTPAQGADNLFDLFLADQRRGKGKELRSHHAAFSRSPSKWLRSGGTRASAG